MMRRLLLLALLVVFVSPPASAQLAVRGKKVYTMAGPAVEDGIVIVDQHAAHERLVYERLKAQVAEHGVTAQALLIPEIVEFSAGDCARLLEVGIWGAYRNVVINLPDIAFLFFLLFCWPGPSQKRKDSK